MRILSFVLLAAFMVAVAGCGEETSASDPVGAVSVDETFATDPIGGEGHIACVNGQQVRVYEFSTASERDSVAESLDPNDASQVGGASVAWVGDPIFWRSGNQELVMYAGGETSVIDHLDDSFGERVSQGRGRPSAPDAFTC